VTLATKAFLDPSLGGDTHAEWDPEAFAWTAFRIQQALIQRKRSASCRSVLSVNIMLPDPHRDEASSIAGACAAASEFADLARLESWPRRSHAHGATGIVGTS
jgi:hypothetical protein